MNNNYTSTNESFQIFLADRDIPDPDELLGRALKYLKDKGEKVSFKGFDKNNTPIIEINNMLYKFDKCFGLWQSAKFTKIKNNFLDIKLSNRKSKIESFYS